MLVVRGDIVEAGLVRADAARFARRFTDVEWTGVSGYYAADDAEVDVVCQTKLSQFPTVAVFTRADLTAAGIDIKATFRTPHVTLASATVELVVERLVRCPHAQHRNPYYEAETTEEGR